MADTPPDADLSSGTPVARSTVVEGRPAVVRMRATVAMVPEGRERGGAVRRAVSVVAGLRVSLGVVAWLSLKLFPTHIENGDWLQFRLPQGSWLWSVVGPWQRWDALWYQHLATDGYRHHSVDVAFFPLYPAVTHAAGVVLAHQFAVAGLVVSTLALVAALVLLENLVGEDTDPETARRTVLYMALAPTAFYFLAPYTESLFLALSVASFLAARRRAWPAAAVCGALAAVARPTGVLLAVPLAVEAGADMLARRRRGLRPVRLAHLTPASPVVAAVSYFAYAATRLDTPMGPVGAERAWNVRAVPPWRGLMDSLHAVLTAQRPEEVVNLVAALLLLVSIPFMFRRMPLSYLAYATAMVLPICSREAYASPLMSSARFAVVVFPMFVVLARAGRCRLVDLLVKGVSPALMVALFVSFVHYGFVG